MFMYHYGINWLNYLVYTNIMISHGLNCEMIQVYQRLHILQSETRLAEILMKDNLKPRFTFSHLILLTVTDYFSHTIFNESGGRHWICFKATRFDSYLWQVGAFHRILQTLFQTYNDENKLHSIGLLWCLLCTRPLRTIIISLIFFSVIHLEQVPGYSDI
jgi:hypothetical protein